MRSWANWFECMVEDRRAELRGYHCNPFTDQEREMFEREFQRFLQHPYASQGSILNEPIN